MKTEISQKFVERLNQYYQNKVRISPVHSNRASSLGHPCLRYLVYLRTRWQDQLPAPVGRIKVYERGVEDEKTIIRQLMDLGYEVVETRRTFYDKDFNITGVIDAKIKGFEIEKPVPAEIKSLSPAHFKRLNTANDFKNAKEHWIRGYYTQLNLYLYLSSLDKQKIEEWGIFVLENKLDGDLKLIVVDFDYDEVENALKKAEEIEKYVKSGELPERIDDYKVCIQCPFRHICLPGVETQGWDYSVDETVLEVVKRLWELKKEMMKYDEIVSEYETYKEQLKELLKKQIEGGSEEILVGDYLVKAKKVRMKRLDEKAIPPEVKEKYVKISEYIRLDIVNFKEEE